MDKLTEYKDALEVMVTRYMGDDDKVLFALGMILDRAQNRDELEADICNAYRTGRLGKLLFDLIEIEIIDDASQSVIQEMSK